jgi:hypothetical protein
MQMPSLKKFLDIKDPHESLEPPKVPETTIEELGPKEVFMSWEKTLSPSDKTVISDRFTRPAIMIGIVVGIILLIMQEFILMITIGSIIFFLQALRKMLPESLRYEISSHGILVGDDMYYWGKLRRFFFITREGSEVLAIDTTLGFPGRIYIHFDQSDKGKIKETLDRYLHYLESEPRTVFDNTYERIVGKFNIEDDSVLSNASESVNEKRESGEEGTHSDSE